MMKKIVLLSILCVSAIGVNAQYLGIKGGLNLSDFHIKKDKITDENLRTGYHFGAFLQVPLSEGFAVQPEVLYSTRGAKAFYKNELNGLDGSVSYNLDYIDIPLLGVLKLGSVADIYFGPYFGFTSSTRIKAAGDFGENQENFDKHFIKTLDYGLVVGAAVNFGALSVGARYNYGLQKLEDSALADMLIGNATNRNFQIYAALRIGNYD